MTGRYKGIKDQLKIFTLRKKKLEGNGDVLNSDKEALNRHQSAHKRHQRATQRR